MAGTNGCHHDPLAGRRFLSQEEALCPRHIPRFNRVVIMGGELPDGHVADSNYVWLSSWQLENINQNYLLPVDFETYRGLKNNIAKALVPLLQLWLYASRTNGIFEKRYDDLCELLSLRPQKYPSDIRKQLGPSLDELQSKGFLSAWSLELTNDGRSHKITTSHGPKFFADQRSQTPVAPKAIEADTSPLLVAALVSKQVMEPQAIKLLRSLPPGQPILDQLEYIDSIVQRGRIENPPGFYVSMLKANIPVPDSFETSTQRKARQSKEREAFERQTLEFEQSARYQGYLRSELDIHISTAVGADQLALLIKSRLPECKKKYPNVPQSTLVEIAESYVRSDIRDSLPLLSFEEFRRSSMQGNLF